METKEYNLKINQEAKQILITGITSNSVAIDFSGDIDFTKLVSELTESLDDKALLSPSEGNDSSEESNLKLILETIVSIIEEYNKTVTSLVENTEEETVTGENSEDIFDETDELF